MSENTGYKETCNACWSIWGWVDTCCPECGSKDTEEFHVIECHCSEYKNGVREEQKEIECHGCSEAGGADRPVCHLPPACKK